MAGWVVAVDATAENGDSVAVRLERAPMRLPVDAARQTADHDEAGGCKFPAEHPRHLSSVR